MTTNGGNRIYINLLPKEIINKRKAEKRLIYAFFIAISISALLFAVFTINVLRVSAREQAIKRLEQENANYADAIGEIKGFQDKKDQVEQREKLIDSVSNLKFSWSKFLNDISLIIPNDVWLVKISSDSSVISFEGMAKLNDSGSTDAGHRLVAKWLVHLGQINSIYDVWLTTSEKSDEESTEVIKFTTTAKIKQPEEDKTTSVVPAPPPSGQPQGGSQ